MVIVDGDNEAGLEYNCRQLGLEVRQSDIRDAGRGLFVTNAMTKGTVVGYVFGIIRSAKRYGDIMDDPSSAIGPEIEVAEDAANGILRAFSIDDTVGDEYSILMSRQCPIGVMNDRKDKQTKSKPNVTVAQPKGWHCQSDAKDALMHWKMFPVTLTEDLAAGAELYLDYRWDADEWKYAKMRMSRRETATLRQAPATRADFLKKQWANALRWCELPRVKKWRAKFRYDIFSGAMKPSHIADLSYVKLAPSTVLPGLMGLIIAKMIDREM